MNLFRCTSDFSLIFIMVLNDDCCCFSTLANRIFVFQVHCFIFVVVLFYTHSILHYLQFLSWVNISTGVFIETQMQQHKLCIAYFQSNLVLLFFPPGFIFLAMSLMRWEHLMRNTQYSRRHQWSQSKQRFNLHIEGLWLLTWGIDFSWSKFTMQCRFIIYPTLIMFKQRQPASSKHGSLVITVDGSQLGRNLQGSNTTSWSKLVMDMYQPGTSAR